MGLKERLEKWIYTVPAHTHTHFQLLVLTRRLLEENRQAYILQNNRTYACVSVFAGVCVSAPERVSVLTYSSGYYH